MSSRSHVNNERLMEASRWNEWCIWTLLWGNHTASIWWCVSCRVWFSICRIIYSPKIRTYNVKTLDNISTKHCKTTLKLQGHTMDLLWEKFQWILPLYMKPISFQSKASVVCSVTAAIFIGFCLMKVNVFSQHIGKKTNEYMNSAEQITRNWNVDQLSVLITSWDII